MLSAPHTHLTSYIFHTIKIKIWEKELYDEIVYRLWDILGRSKLPILGAPLMKIPLTTPFILSESASLTELGASHIVFQLFISFQATSKGKQIFAHHAQILNLLTFALISFVTNNEMQKKKIKSDSFPTWFFALYNPPSTFNWRFSPFFKTVLIISLKKQLFSKYNKISAYSDLGFDLHDKWSDC